MSRIYGANPRPRILVEGLEEDLSQSFDNRFPTVKVVQHRNDVDQSEYDVLVTRKSAEDSDRNIYPVVFGRPLPNSFVVDRVQDGNTQFVISWVGTTRGHELHVPATIPQPLQRFIQTRVIPIVQEQDENYVLGVTVGEPTGIITPFITTARGEILAGRFWRSSHVDCWVFPSEIVQHAAECVAVAVDYWRGQDVNRFPRPEEDWETEARWLTLPEAAATKELQDLVERRDRVLEELNAQEEALTSKLAEARAHAAATDRLLLTAQREPLVRAVQRCLEEFGFSVRNMDDEWPESDKREDLRVSLSIEPDWTNLTEVRGYAKGAEVNDFLRLGRFRKRYAQDEGHFPSSAWYVPNEFVRQDPATRGEAMRTNNKEVESFGEDDGLVVGTVSLFDLLMDLRGGLITQQEIQKLLMGNRGRLTYNRRS